MTVTTPLGFTALGWKFYLVWATVAFSIIPSVYFFFPETTGLSVEEIDQVFIDSPSVLKTVALAEQRRKQKRETGEIKIENFNDGKKPETFHGEL